MKIVAIKKQVGNRVFNLAVPVLADSVQVKYTAWTPMPFKFSGGGYKQEQSVTKLEDLVYLANWRSWKIDEPDESFKELWSVVVTDPTAVSMAWHHFSPKQQAEFEIAKTIRQQTSLLIHKPKWKIIPVEKLPYRGTVDKKIVSQNTKLACVTLNVSDAIMVRSESGFEKGLPVERYLAYAKESAFPGLSKAG